MHQNEEMGEHYPLINLPNTPAPKALKTSQKRWVRNWKSQKTKDFAVRLYFEVSSPVKFYQHDCPNMT